MKQINPKNSEENEKEKSIYLLGKKTIHFTVQKYSKCSYTKKESSIKYPKENLKEGRWSYIEQIKFIKALSKNGPNWKKISETFCYRTLTQIRSHAQKVFKKLKKCKNSVLGIDFTTNSIKSFKDMINHIKSVNNNYDINKVFLYLSDIKQKNYDELSKKVMLKELPSLVNAIMCCAHDELINRQKNIFNKVKMYNNKFDLINQNKTLLLNSINNMNNYLNVLILDFLNESITSNNLINKLNNNILENKTEAIFSVAQSSYNDSLYSVNNSIINKFL